MHEPAPPSLWTINGAVARRKRMSDQVTNKSAAVEQSQVCLQEMPPPSSISSSDKLLSRIGILQGKPVKTAADPESGRGSREKALQAENDTHPQ
jgi:hypothetical protein